MVDLDSMSAALKPSLQFIHRIKSKYYSALFHITNITGLGLRNFSVLMLCNGLDSWNPTLSRGDVSIGVLARVTLI